MARRSGGAQGLGKRWETTTQRRCHSLPYPPIPPAEDDDVRARRPASPSQQRARAEAAGAESEAALRRWHDSVRSGTAPPGQAPGDLGLGDLEGGNRRDLGDLEAAVFQLCGLHT
jgi:hypothetical protein